LSSFIDAFIGMLPTGRMDKNYTSAYNTYETLGFWFCLYGQPAVGWTEAKG